MKILFLNAYFEPEIAASLYLYSNLAEDLAAAGHEVTIYAPTPTRGVSREMRRVYTSAKRKEYSRDNRLKIVRLPIPREGRNPRGRAIRYVLMETIFFVVGVTREYDIAFLYSTPPTQGALAAMLRRVKGRPVLYNIQDLFPESLSSSGIAARNGLVWKLGTRLQAFTYRNVSGILTISEELKDSITRGGFDPNRVAVVPNWVNSDEVFPVSRDSNELVSKYSLDPSKFYVTYCGNLGYSQNLGLLARVAKRLRSVESIFFVVIGDGVARKELEAATSNFQNFRVLPFQPYERIADVFSLGDLGLIVSKPHVGTNSVPSKTWSIMAAERPVVASFDEKTELNSILGQSKSGITCPPDDEDALINAILLLHNDRELGPEMGANGRDFVLQHLSRKKATERIIEFIETFAHESGSRS